MLDRLRSKITWRFAQPKPFLADIQMPDSDAHLDELQRYLDELREFVSPSIHASTSPTLVSSPPGPRWREDQETSGVLAAHKIVRTVSALQGAAQLLRGGFALEARVLLRLAYEALATFFFLLEEDPEGNAQTQYQELYFDEDVRTIEEILSTDAHSPRIAHRRVTAATARVLSPDDPHSAQQRLNAEYDVYSGVAHADYPSTMELYGGLIDNPRWHLSGMAGTWKVVSGERQVALCLHRAINAARLLAEGVGRGTDANRLDQLREELEGSEVYPEAAGTTAT